MRRDIQINTSIGDIVFVNQNQLKAYAFNWVTESDLFLYGEVTIPSHFDVNILSTEGVKIEIPYTPIFKPFKIRIMRQYDDVTHVAIVNPVTGDEWFDVYAQLYNQQEQRICASQLIIINQDTYLIQLDNIKGAIYIWSSCHTDANNIVANTQNRNLLLQCVPTNNYRYPTSGIGLVRFLHSNLNQTALASVLQSEFESDKVTVISAAFDSSTGDMELNLDFSEADASV